MKNWDPDSFTVSHFLKAQLYSVTHTFGRTEGSRTERYFEFKGKTSGKHFIASNITKRFAVVSSEAGLNTKEMTNTKPDVPVSFTTCGKGIFQPHRKLPHSP